MEIKKLIDYFCDKADLPEPIYRKEFEIVLTRMLVAGLITEQEKLDYMHEMFDL